MRQWDKNGLIHKNKIMHSDIFINPFFLIIHAMNVYVGEGEERKTKINATDEIYTQNKIKLSV